jgi:hypothetical protein
MVEMMMMIMKKITCRLWMVDVEWWCWMMMVKMMLIEKRSLRRGLLVVNCCFPFLCKRKGTHAHRYEKANWLDGHGVRNPKVTWADLRQFRRTGLAGPPRSQLWNYAWSFPRSYTHERVAVYLLPRSGILTHGPEWHFNLITGGAV